jgi:hypothetical protein
LFGELPVTFCALANVAVPPDLKMPPPPYMFEAVFPIIRLAASNVTVAKEPRLSIPPPTPLSAVAGKSASLAA